MIEGFHRVDPPRWMKRRANQVARECASALGLPGIFVRFWCVDPGVFDQTAGWATNYDNIEFQSWVINLVPEKIKTPGQLKAIIAHESRHLWQRLHNIHDWSDYQLEVDANDFAYKMTGIHPLGHSRE